MNLNVIQIGATAWRAISRDVHNVVFQTDKPAEFDRIDYALGVEDEAGQPMAYVTVREHDHESVYWQFGGAFPPAKNSPVAYRAFCKVIDWQKAHSKRIAMLVENDNTSMLRIAMKAGFRVIGVRYFKGHILLEHALELSHAV